MDLSGCCVEEYEHKQAMREVGAVQAAPVSSSPLQYLRVFPVKNKRPLVKGWQASAPISLDAVAEWESKFPGCGWGAAITTDMMVIDCDSDTAASALCELGEIPATLTTLTPRGFHLWFRIPETGKVRNRVGVMPGIDVRTKDGFVVVPPSENYAFADLSAPIADAPDWILRLVMGDSVPVPSPKRVREMPVHQR